MWFMAVWNVLFAFSIYYVLLPKVLLYISTKTYIGLLYTDIHTHTHIYSHIYIYTHRCTYICTHVDTYMNISAYLYVICIHMCVYDAPIYILLDIFCNVLLYFLFSPTFDLHFCTEFFENLLSQPFISDVIFSWFSLSSTIFLFLCFPYFYFWKQLPTTPNSSDSLLFSP